MLKKLKKKRGFTLVELIVALGLSAMVMVTGMWIVQYFTRMNNQADANSLAQQLAKDQLSYIESELRYAFTAEIRSTVPTKIEEENYACLFVEDGIIKRKDPGHTGRIISDEGYGKFEYELKFSSAGESEKVIRVDISVFKNNNEVFSTYASYFLGNMAGDIEGSVGETIYYNNVHKPVTSITITSPNFFSIQSGTMSLSAVAYPTNASNRGVVWDVVEGSSIAKVEDGVLKPLRNGTVTVRARAIDNGDVFAEQKIEVSGMVMVEQIKLRTGHYESDTVYVGFERQLYYDILPAYATSKELSWEISYKSRDVIRVNVDENGKVRAYQYDRRVGDHIKVRAYAKDGSGVYGEIQLIIRGY